MVWPVLIATATITLRRVDTGTGQAEIWPRLRYQTQVTRSLVIREICPHPGACSASPSPQTSRLRSTSGACSGTRTCTLGTT